MAFFDVSRSEQDPIVDYHDPVGRYFDNIEHLGMVKPHPQQADWGASVYFDPAKYPDDFALERVRSYYARNHRGRNFLFKELLQSTLGHASPFLTKTAEQGFIHRGFYSDIEAADYARGRGDEVLVQSRLMRSACGHQLAKLAAFYQGEDDVKIVWQGSLGRLMGGFVVPIPLVAEGGAYWPRREFPDPTTIHFAHTSVFRPAKVTPLPG